MRKQDITAAVEAYEPRSAWKRGVKETALEMLEMCESDFIQYDELESELLNGASNAHDYSYGGCALVYDEDIAERFCTPSELKRKRGGELPPSSNEEWLDVQARGVYQAINLIKRITRSKPVLARL